MKPCKRCRGTGTWTPDPGDADSDTAVTSRACLWCDGSGEVPTLEEERAEWALEQRQRLFKGRHEAPTERPTPASLAGPDAWLAMVQRWWAEERRARISAGACRDCGERGCPRVGGKDAACVPGGVG